MFIALVDFAVAAAERDAALATLLETAAEVRALPGCRTFRPHADPGDATCLGVVHEWDSAEAFAAYLASPAFAETGRLLRPLMTAAPSSRRYRAELIEEVA